MELIAQLVDIFLHLDNYLGAFLHDYGLWVYALLFAIIFAEPGVVVTPFLPRHSLFFVGGAPHRAPSSRNPPAGSTNRRAGTTTPRPASLPTLRTFAPFGAGVGRMPYARFL